MKINITWNHPQSKYGYPVVLNEDKEVITPSVGIRFIKKELDLTSADIADECGVSVRTVEGWLQGTKPKAESLIVIYTMLKRRRK